MFTLVFYNTYHSSFIRREAKESNKGSVFWSRKMSLAFSNEFKTGACF